VFAPIVGYVFLGLSVGGLMSVLFYREYKPPVPKKPTAVRVRPISEEYAIKFVSKNKRLQTFSKKYSLGMAEDFMRAGIIGSPYVYVSKFLFFTFISMMVALPIAIILAVVIHPVFLSIVIIPAIVFYFPRLKVKNEIGNRRREIEDELPFFTIFASIMQSVGLSMYNSFVSIINRGIFKRLEHEALLIKRNVEFFYRDQVSALEEIARVHPNEKFRTLLLGYTSEWRAGGDVSAYLDAKADDFLHEMRFRYQHYANFATDIGEFIVSLFFVLPLLVLTSAFIYPSASISTLSIIVVLVQPLLLVASYMIINTSQPKSYDIIEGKIAYAIIAGIPAILVSFFAYGSSWLSFASGIISASVVYGTGIMMQKREIDMLEKALPQFLRDITEYRKMGYDLSRAIMKIASENSYNPIFDTYIGGIAKQLELGLPLKEVKMPSRSWITRMSMFLLSEIVESGGGSISALETLTNFTNQVYIIKKETRSSMRLYEALAIFTPIGLAFAISLMSSLLTAFSTITSTATQIGILSEISHIPKTLIDISNMMVITSSIFLAILTSKTIDFTAKNTIKIAILTSTAIISIFTMNALIPQLFKTLLSFNP
jgi:flagellar protein FlaJ